MRLVGGLRGKQRRGRGRCGRRWRGAIGGGTRAWLQLAGVGSRPLGRVGPGGGAHRLGRDLRGGGSGVTVDGRDVRAVGAVRCVGTEVRRRQRGRRQRGGCGARRGLRQRRGRGAGAAANGRPRESQRAAAPAPRHQFVLTAASACRARHPEQRASFRCLQNNE